MYCTYCGFEISETMKFCPKCGKNNLFYSEEKTIDIEDSKEESTEIINEVIDGDINVSPDVNTYADALSADLPEEDPLLVTGRPQDVSLTVEKQSVGDIIKEKISSWWSKLSLFMKINICSIAFCVLWVIITFFFHRALSIVFAILALICVIVSLLIHKEIIDFAQKAVKYAFLVLALVALFISFKTIAPSKDSSDKGVDITTSSETSTENSKETT